MILPIFGIIINRSDQSQHCIQQQGHLWLKSWKHALVLNIQWYRKTKIIQFYLRHAAICCSGSTVLWNYLWSQLCELEWNRFRLQINRDPLHNSIMITLLDDNISEKRFCVIQSKMWPQYRQQMYYCFCGVGLIRNKLSVQ